MTLTCLGIFILFQACTDKYNGVKINGKVRNSNQEYVYLAHLSLYRGNFNSDGFRSIGDRIDDQGDFTLTSDKLIDAADYWIQIKDKNCQLVLFNGDNIKLEFDLNNMNNSFFALGKGAGKINVLQLSQFETDLSYDPLYTLDAYKSRVDSTINSQLAVLNLIYKKDLKNEILEKAENKQRIIDIIKRTPLAKKEYEFLKQKISNQDIYYLANFIFYLSQEKKTDTLKVDFTIPYFSCFNSSRYKKFENINSWQLEDCINRILRIEYFKNIQNERKNLTYGDLKIDNYSRYQDWSFTYVKNNLNPEVFDEYFASILLRGLSMGSLDKDLYEKYIKNCNGVKYLNSVNRYIGLLNNGLRNSKYNLNAYKSTLDSTRLDSLINSYKGKNLYLLVWSAQYAGSTIISELPSIMDFEKENKGEIESLYICVDEAKYKNLWATRIIDNSWKGNHYFLPAENNENFINHFAAQKISSFCYGGATFTFLDKEGNVFDSVEAPFLLTKEKLNRYLSTSSL